MVRDTEQRTLLYQLARAREQLLRRHAGEQYTKDVDLVYVNLVRMWSQL